MKYLLFSSLLIFIFCISELSAQKLIPGDGVRIIFLDVMDNISGDYYIQPGGNLQLPFVGIIPTDNRDFKEVKNDITTKFDSLYRNPKLNVLALYRINILGEVNTPGYHYVTEDQKFTDVLALAGGSTSSAALDDIYIIRGDKEIELDAENIILDGDTAADIGLQSGDQIYVPRSFWADPARFTWIFTAIATVVTIVAIFLVN
jgi:polysaccharide export outer membrane protein